jgi:hypothetical protein
VHESNTLKVQHGEVNFVAVASECARSIIKTELELNQEGSEFSGVCPIKWVRFSDFRTRSVTLILLDIVG